MSAQATASVARGKGRQDAVSLTLVSWPDSALLVDRLVVISWCLETDFGINSGYFSQVEVFSLRTYTSPASLEQSS